MGLPDVVDGIVADFLAESVPCPVLYGPDHIAEHAATPRIVVVPTDDTYDAPNYVQNAGFPSEDMSDGQQPRTIATRVEGARATIWASGTLASVIFTADSTTNTLTAVAHGFDENHPLQLTTTGTLPAGLYILTTYYAVNVTDDDFQLSIASGGSAIDFTSNGSGVHTATEDSSLQQRADYDALHALINQFILSLHRVNPGNYHLQSGVTTETTRVDRLGYVYTLVFSVRVPIIDTPWPTETGVSQDSTVQLIKPDGTVIEQVEIT